MGSSSLEDDAVQVASPFVVPTDEDLFRSMASAKSRTQGSADDRAAKTKKRIHEKTTFASRMQASFAKTDVAGSRPETAVDIIPSAASQVIGGDCFAPIRGTQSEAISEFLAKKREIFFVQMSLDTKRAEICKLERRALQRENALKKSEEMLEEDAIKFDAFLKENDEKVQQALKNAEVEAKKKHEKTAEIKRLHAEIASIRSEFNKFEELLEDFKQCKTFIEDITPQEWFQEQQEKREKIKEERLEQWRRQCAAVKKRKTDAATTKARLEQAYHNAKTQQEAVEAEKQLKEAAENLKACKLLKEPPKPTLEETVDSTAAAETYFKEPTQLLELFAGLEEQNLFLIQNLQETEESLDKSRSKLQQTRNRVDGEIERLNAEVATLEEAVRTKRRFHRNVQTGRLPDTATFRYGENAESVSPEQLASQLAAVYRRCGFVGDSSVGELTMLTHIEAKIEELLSSATSIPKDFVDASERSREKERRQKQRAEKQAQQQQEHEARVKRALERAEAPVFKKTGKPEMFRSVLRPKKRTVVRKETIDVDQELRNFLATAF